MRIGRLLVGALLAMATWIGTDAPASAEVKKPPAVPSGTFTLTMLTADEVEVGLDRNATFLNVWGTGFFVSRDGGAVPATRGRVYLYVQTTQSQLASMVQTCAAMVASSKSGPPASRGGVTFNVTLNNAKIDLSSGNASIPAELQVSSFRCNV